MTPVIAWFDPGKMTGGAVYDTGADRFISGQYTDHELREALRALILKHPGELSVGYELYIQTPRSKGIAKYSVSAIQIIKELCEEHEVPILKGQPSSVRNFKSTAVFLRRLGWYAPGKQHANDAAAHLFRHLIRQRPIPENIRNRLPAGY